MHELVQAGANTYYVNSPAKIGIYVLDGQSVCLIDSGNDRDAGKKVLKILYERAWKPEMIISTHSHADHIGGSALIRQRTGARVFCAGIDHLISLEPLLEPSYLYGGCPPRELRNKFLMAPSCEVEELTEAVLPPGLEMLRLDGHSFAMTAVKTDDEVWFLADSLTSVEVLQKYHVTFLYDPAAYIASLKAVMELSGRLFVPTHAEPVEDIRPLAAINLEKVYEIIALIKAICARPTGFDDLLRAVFEHYGLAMDFNQYALVGSTLRSYLAYLRDSGEMDCAFEDNRLLWRAV